MMERTLDGRVAVVAGAARGAGRGIAHMLGEAGAVVYCTGRSTRGRPPTGRHAGRPETIEETAELVNRAGGRGVAVRVDHASPQEVDGLFERIVSHEGRVDVVVNVLGGQHAADWSPSWRQSHETGREMVDEWLWPHLLTARAAAAAMLPRRRGMIVEIVEGETLRYHGTLYWDLSMTLLKRLAYGLAEELAPHGVAALALAPGFMRTEEVLAHFGTTEEQWRDVAETDAGRSFGIAGSETPCFVGRAVAALAADPDVMRWSGSVCSSGELARIYDFTDVDGSKPDWPTYFSRNFPEHHGPPRSGRAWTFAAG